MSLPDCLFKNDHFIAVDKPAGWLTVPSRLGASDARLCLGIELQKREGRLWPVHRLDVEVTGLVLFARGAEAHRAASRWFENHEVRKRYSALSEGTATAHSEVRWECSLVRGKKRSFEAPHGKPSVTLARCLGMDAQAQALRWELEPLTGRSHQLRFELARHGCPILGDALYGARRAWRAEGIALRSTRIGFEGAPQAARFGLPPFLETDPL